jgi:hypothetical protein
VSGSRGSPWQIPATPPGFADESCSAVPHFPRSVGLQTQYVRCLSRRPGRPVESALFRIGHLRHVTVRRPPDQRAVRSRGQSRAAPLATRAKDSTSCTGAHARTETMLLCPLTHIGLIGPLHVDPPNTAGRSWRRGNDGSGNGEPMTSTHHAMGPGRRQQPPGRTTQSSIRPSTVPNPERSSV